MKAGAPLLCDEAGMLQAVLAAADEGESAKGEGSGQHQHAPQQQVTLVTGLGRSHRGAALGLVSALDIFVTGQVGDRIFGPSGHPHYAA